jgi:hypothetical protein
MVKPESFEKTIEGGPVIGPPSLAFDGQQVSGLLVS